METYKYYKVVRRRNPHIPARRVVEYLKAIEKAERLGKAFSQEREV